MRIFLHGVLRRDQTTAGYRISSFRYQSYYFFFLAAQFSAGTIGGWLLIEGSFLFFWGSPQTSAMARKGMYSDDY